MPDGSSTRTLNITPFFITIGGTCTLPVATVILGGVGSQTHGARKLLFGACGQIAKFPAGTCVKVKEPSAAVTVFASNGLALGPGSTLSMTTAPAIAEPVADRTTPVTFAEPAVWATATYVPKFTTNTAA